MLKLVALATLVTFHCLVEASAPSSLKLVHVFFRHGHRNPTSLYPNDPNTVNDFHMGLGHITKQGRNEQLALGRFLRSKYDGFLTHNPLEVKARSSGRDRCLESMTANLVGLYPQGGDYDWNDSVVLQPIPISTMPVAYDIMLYEEANCKTAEWLYDTIIHRTPQGKAILREHGDFMRFLEEKSGLTIKSWVNVRDLLDTITIERDAGLQVPDWVTPEVLAKMAEIAKYTTQVHYSFPQYNRFKAGLLMYDIRTNMKRVADGNANAVKIYMYASHDVLVAAFLSIFNQFNQLAVPPSTAVGVELHNTPENGYTVKMWFKNETGAPEIPVAWCTGGRTECSLDQFLRQTQRSYLDGKTYRIQCLERPMPGDVKMYGDF